MILKKILVFLFCPLFLFANDTVYLNHKEKVLATVLILKVQKKLRPYQKAEIYNEALKKENVTNEEFTEYLNNLYNDLDKWYKTLEKIDTFSKQNG